MKFYVEIREELSRIIQVEAKDEAQAKEFAQYHYNEGNITLSADDYADYNEFSVYRADKNKELECYVKEKIDSEGDIYG